jgi:ferritin-like metal-binding protein YciE
MAITGTQNLTSSEQHLSIESSGIDHDTARRFFVIGLRNIHATVHQGKAMVEAQIDRLEQYPELKEKLLSHRQEKDAQLARVERILGEMDESRSAFKDATMHAMGAVSTTATAMAGDEILKNCFSTIGLASFEAAAYETLVYFAQLCGAHDAVAPLQQSLQEERAMAGFVQDHLQEIATRFLALKSEDQQASH